MRLRQSVIRDHLNRHMKIGKEYSLQEIYRLFNDVSDLWFETEIRSALKVARHHKQVIYRPRAYYTRIALFKNPP